MSRARVDAGLEAFSRDGVVQLHGVLEEPNLLELTDELEQAISGVSHYFRRLHLWKRSEQLRLFCLQSKMPQIARTLLQVERVRLLYDQAFFKEPSSVATPWHNDLPYYPVRAKVATIWLALDAIDQHNGAMEFIAGSHLWQRWFQPFIASEGGGVDRAYEVDPRFEALPDFDAQREQLDIVNFEMAPGDVLAFHGLTVHGAMANKTQGARRRAYAIRYVEADAEYIDGPAVNPLLRVDAQVQNTPLNDESFPLALGA